MINATGLEVILTLDDRLTAGFNKSFNSIQQQVEKTSESFVHLGREISQTGRNMTFLGAAIVGPMAIAFKTASNYSIEAGESMKRLTASAIDFQKTIGAAMLPVVEKLTRLIEGLNEWFKRLDPQLKNSIIQGALITGIFLVLGGSILSLIGKLGSLVGRVLQFAAANIPLLVMAGALLAIIYYWEQMRSVVMPIIDALQISVDMLAIGYNKVALAMSHVAAFGAAMVGNQDLAVWYEEQAIQIESSIATLEADMTRVMSGEGTWASAVDQGIQKIQSLWEFLKNPPLAEVDAALLQFSQKFSSVFKQAYDSAVNIGAQSANILVSQINTFSAGFGKAFSDMVLHGKNFGESMNAVFMNMLDALISSVVQMIAQWVIYQAFQGIILSASIGMATAVATAWATAAAMVSLATFGANAGPAAGAIAGVTAMATALAAIPKAAEGANIMGGGSIMVGERGPEILNLPAGARVTPLDKAGSGVSVHINGDVYTQTTDQIEELANHISRLLDEKKRSRVR